MWSATLIPTLPAALDVPTDLVRKAVEDTQREIHEAEEAAWKAAFIPHAIVQTERERPTQIFIAAILGVDRLRRVDFDLSENPETYVQQALDGVREKLARWKSGQIPTFGRPTGIIINYSPDYAVRFDLEGNAAEVLDRAYRIGDVSLSIGKRPVTARELEALFG